MFSQVWSTFTNRTFMKPNAYPVWSMPGHHYKLFTILRPTLYTTSSCWLGEPSSFWSSFCCGSRSSMNTAIAFPFAISGRSRSSLRNLFKAWLDRDPVFMAVHGCACPQSGSKATLYQKYLKRKKCLLALFTFSTLIGIFTSLQIAVPFHCLWKDQAATTKYEKKNLKTPKSKSH